MGADSFLLKYTVSENKDKTCFDRIAFPKKYLFLLTSSQTLNFKCLTQNGEQLIANGPCLQAYANSECPDQPAHPRSLIRAITICLHNHWILNK